jgi:hypothetical protein
MPEVVTKKSSICIEYLTPTKAFSSSNPANKGLPASSRLLKAGDDAFDILARLNLLPPRAIGMHTAADLIGACLRWQNSRYLEPDAHGREDSSEATFVIESAWFDILIEDDSRPFEPCRPWVTTICNHEFGPFVAYGLAFAPPTWGELAGALKGLDRSPSKLIYLRLLSGGAA